MPAPPKRASPQPRPAGHPCDVRSPVVLGRRLVAGFANAGGVAGGVWLWLVAPGVWFCAGVIAGSVWPGVWGGQIARPLVRCW